MYGRFEGEVEQRVIFVLGVGLVSASRASLHRHMTTNRCDDTHFLCSDTF